MEPWMALPAMLAVHGLFWLLRRSDTGIGQRIRDTDRDAYDMAIQDRQREIDEIRAYGRKHGYE